MLADYNDLLAATVAFILSHMVLSSRPLRAMLVQRLGDGGFRAGYSILVILTFVWMLLAYGAAPYYPVWEPPPWTAAVAAVIMIPATLLFVIGLATPSPTAVGGEQRLDVKDARSPAVGILSVTRHPFLCGVTLFAIAHLLANGDLATIILMVGLALLSVAGMMHIDARRAASLGPLWGPIAISTSRLPFLAIAQGRAEFDLAGIGWWRILLAVVVYCIFIAFHGVIAGVPLFAGLHAG
ncbi:MAG: NnrU family protein [Pseudomonadota bacterium]